MKPLSSRLGRTATLLVVLSTVAVAFGSGRIKVLFQATFDQPQADGIAVAPLQAEVGEFETEQTPGMFKILTDGESEGVMAIFGHDPEADAELIARFDERFIGEEIRTRFSVLPLQTKANLNVRVEDDDEGVMIDIGWKDGVVSVGSHGESTDGTPGTGSGGGMGGGGSTGGSGGGSTGGGSGGGSSGGGSSGGGSGGASPTAGFLYSAGVEYDVMATIRRIAPTEATYVVSFQWEGGSYTLGGGLTVDGPLQASQLRFVREANGKHGVFFVDDVIVTETIGG